VFGGWGAAQSSLMQDAQASGPLMQLRFNTYHVLVLLNAACYNFAALGVDERCRTPRHPKGQLEPNVLACFTGGGDFWGTRLRLRHHFLSRTPCGADYSHADYSDVMLITKIRFGGAPHGRAVGALPISDRSIGDRIQ